MKILVFYRSFSNVSCKRVERMLISSALFNFAKSSGIQVGRVLCSSKISGGFVGLTTSWVSCSC